MLILLLIFTRTQILIIKCFILTKLYNHLYKHTESINFFFLLKYSSSGIAMA